ADPVFCQEVDTSRAASRIAILLAGFSVWPGFLSAQVVFFDVGISTSWGKGAPGIVCEGEPDFPRCSNGFSISGGTTRFVAGGSSVIFPGIGPFGLEAGLT